LKLTFNWQAGAGYNKRKVFSKRYVKPLTSEKLGRSLATFAAPQDERAAFSIFYTL
jgi:hypothetical protein